MAAKPVPDRELATLHEQISGDVTELRRRMGRMTGDGGGSPEAMLRVVVEAFRVVRALRGLAPGAGRAVVMVAGLAAGLRVRRQRRQTQVAGRESGAYNDGGGSRP